MKNPISPNSGRTYDINHVRKWLKSPVLLAVKAVFEQTMSLSIYESFILS